MMHPVWIFAAIVAMVRAGPQAITTGYSVQNVAFPYNDATCGLNPAVSVSYYTNGVCIPNNSCGFFQSGYSCMYSVDAQVTDRTSNHKLDIIYHQS